MIFAELISPSIVGCLFEGTWASSCCSSTLIAAGRSALDTPPPPSLQPPTDQRETPGHAEGINLHHDFDLVSRSKNRKMDCFFCDFFQISSEFLGLFKIQPYGVFPFCSFTGVSYTECQKLI